MNKTTSSVLDSLNLTEEQVKMLREEIGREISKHAGTISTTEKVVVVSGDKALKIANWSLVGVLGATLVTGIVRSIMTTRQGGANMGAAAPNQ